MKVAPVPAKERERLKALYEYQILNTPPETAYDFITELASTICGTPVSLLTFLDAGKQWVKSFNGLELGEINHGQELSSQAIDAPDKVLVIKDLTAEEGLHTNPFSNLGMPVLFYAGAPIVNPGGEVVGILCVLDHRVRSLTLEQKQKLLMLAGQVVTLLELRKTSRLLQQKKADVDMAYADLENIAHIASHDLRSPLNNIISLAQLIKEELGEAIGDEGNEYINFINETAYYLSDLVSSIHSYSKASKLAGDHADRINTAELIEELMPILKVPENCTISVEITSPEIIAPVTAIKQILFHLLLNAIQYIDKEQGIVKVSISENNSSWLFEISDNGEGIAPADSEKIYLLFKRLRNREKNGENMGIGLSIVKRLIEKMHGTISLSSEPGIGTTFSFSIPK
jgi:signal transduction histidine kinase